MRNKLQNKYVLNRDGVYYYVRRIPKDVVKHYPRNRLYFSLRTKSLTSAHKAAQSLTQKLDEYWIGIRLKNLMIPQLPAGYGIFMPSFMAACFSEYIGSRSDRSSGII